MTINEGDILYCMVNNVPTQCKVHYIGFGGDDVHLLTSLPDNQAFIAETIDLAVTAEECENNHKTRIYNEYHLHYDAITTSDNLILHLLNSCIEGRKIEGVELQAIKDRTSEFIQIDIDEYLNEIKKNEKKVETIVNED